MTVGEAIDSPRLRALAERIASGDAGVVEAFWRELAQETTPLIERDPERSEACWVTFLWRADDPVENVVLVEGINSDDFPDKRMTRLGETDVWYRTFRLRSDVRTEYTFSPNDSLVPKWEETDWDARRANWRLDPLNPKRFFYDRDKVDEKPHQIGSSIVELPDAAKLPWIGKRDGVPVGRVEHHRFTSQILENERDVWTYCPANRQPEGLLVHFDGEWCRETLGLPTVLDNLIAAEVIPPIAAVMIGNVDRNNELPCCTPFARFLAEEIAPWAYELFSMEPDRERAVLAGISYGGLAALFGALEQPETFGSALSQSGSFWWKPNSLQERATMLHGDAPEYASLPSQVARIPKRPIRVYMNAGTMEIRAHAQDIISHLQSNRYMRDVLIAKGYNLTYHEYAGGHDFSWWRGLLADGLIALIGNR